MSDKIDYSIKQKRALMGQFEGIMNIVKTELIEKFGEVRFNEFVINTRKESELLITQLPYIGGNKNRLNEALMHSPLMLAFMRNLEKEGINFHEIGELCYNLFETLFQSMKIPEDFFQEQNYNNIRENANESMLRKYPEDWVYEFVDGDGKTFDFGINYTECGIYKFFKKNKAEHLVTLMCITDYANAQAHGYGLKRTQTIAAGDPLCDFRFIKKGSSPRGWPLENLKKMNMK
jgi:hypothetical protein